MTGGMGVAPVPWVKWRVLVLVVKLGGGGGWFGAECRRRT